MTYSVASNQVHEFIKQIFPFNQLKSQQLHTVTTKCQLVRYRTFQPLFVRESMPAQIAIIYEGKVRLLGYDQRTEKPASLQVVGAGEILGWVGLVRGVPCEIAIASTEVICIMGITQSWEKEVPHYLEDRDNGLRSQVTELQTQLAETREQLTSAQKQLPIAQAQLQTAKIQLATAEAQLPKAQERVATAKQILSTDKDILERMTPLASQGAISIVQAQQRQKVLTRYQEISSSEA